MLPGEPRTLADGKTVMFGTFTCGLYRVTDVATAPKVEFVYSFPGLWCAVPVVVGNYWVWTIPEAHAVVSLDVSNSAKPTRSVAAGAGRQRVAALDGEG